MLFQSGNNLRVTEAGNGVWTIDLEIKKVKESAHFQNVSNPTFEWETSGIKLSGQNCSLTFLDRGDKIALSFSKRTAGNNVLVMLLFCRKY
jgi:hypothetical protein